MAHELGESDWGDWLLGEIAAADPDGVDLWYLGCNGFVLKDSDGTTVWIDPYCGTGDPPKTVRMIPVPFDPAAVESADAVLATHEHSDHVHGPTQGPILANTGATYHAPSDSLAVVEAEGWRDEYGVDEAQFAEVGDGDSFSVGAFDVSVVAVSDADATEPVGYVVEHDAGTLFHGGDTKPGPTLDRVGEAFDVDLAVVAFGTVGLLPDGEGGRSRTKWYCDENEAVAVADAVEADRLLPSHWDVWRNLTADPTSLHDHVRSFPHPERLEVVEIGARIQM
ncbi:MAG: MBL fold metallo-hydrolase [Haloferacaceae archaeon]